ncbi:MAG: hypothetical protein ACRCYV_04090 [Aeromonas sp.]
MAEQMEYPLGIIRVTAIPANQEPRSQFQPQDVAWRGTPPLYAGPVRSHDTKLIKVCQGLGSYWRDGIPSHPMAQQGFIASTVTLGGQGVRRRVLCFTQSGDLVAETYSDQQGRYRFDLLWLHQRYMVVAQDDPAFGPADYNAVAADFIAPQAYPSGAGSMSPASIGHTAAALPLEPLEVNDA